MKYLLTLAVLLSTMLGLFGAAPPVTSGHGAPSSLLTGTPGQLYVNIDDGELFVKRVVGDTSWRRVSSSTNFTTLFNTNEFLNGLLFCRGIQSIGDIQIAVGDFIGATTTEYKFAGATESGMRATSSDPSAGVSLFVNDTNIMNVTPTSVYPLTGTALGGLTRPWGTIYMSEASIGPDKFNVDTNGVITKIGDVSVPTPITVTITNLLPGISTNRLSFIGGILVTNTAIAW